MNTLKNAALLIVMGGVLYFVYITLNKPPAPAGSATMALQHESLEPPDIDIQAGGEVSEAYEPSAPPRLEMSTPEPETSAPPARPRRRPARPLESPDGDRPNHMPRSVAVGEPVQPMNEADSPYQVVETPAPSRRSGGWNSNPNTDNEPPVAPEFPDYPAPNSAPPADGANVAQSTPDPESAYQLLNSQQDSASEAAHPTVQPTPYEEPVVSSPAASSSALTAYTVKQKFHEAQTFVEQGQYKDALVTLTELYRRDDLSAQDREVILQWLDPLAGKVIYSTEHLLAEPYQVRRGEDLLTIAQRLQVPWQLLQNINGVHDPRVVVGSTVLKVVPGPFHAEVDLARNEMTVYLHNMYAGRFSYNIGDEAPRPGQYFVREKSRDRPYYGRDGRVVPAKDPANPYGGWWLDLGSGVALHGSPATHNAAAANLGCMSFSPQDAEDIFSILSQNSTVTIR